MIVRSYRSRTSRRFSRKWFRPEQSPIQGLIQVLKKPEEVIENGKRTRKKSRPDSEESR